jgi:hypothetical protein
LLASGASLQRSALTEAPFTIGAKLCALELADLTETPDGLRAC